MNKHKLFVYGTLRTGEGPIAYITGRLCDLGRFPGLIEGTDKVKGEIIEITDAKLRHFDRYEGFNGQDDDLYKRVNVTAELADGSKVECWVYRFNRAVQPDDYIQPINGISEWDQ